MDEAGVLAVAAVLNALDATTTISNIRIEYRSWWWGSDHTDKHNLTDVGAVALFGALSGSPVAGIDLSIDQVVSDTSLAALREMLCNSTTLTTLTVNLPRIGLATLQNLLAEVVATNMAVLKVGNKIGDDGASAIATALIETSKTTALTELSLSNLGIGATGTVALAGMLKTNTVLSRLDLSRNDIGSAGAAALGDALKDNAALKSINLDTADAEPPAGAIDNAGATALASALLTNNVLEELYVNLGGGGSGATSSSEIAAGVVIGNALKTNTALKILRLADASLGDESAVAIAAGLTVNTALEKLELGNNLISDDGAAALANALTANTVLKELALDKNIINGIGAIALANAIKVNTGLEKLNLDRQQGGESDHLGENAMLGFVQALKENPGPLFEVKLHEPVAAVSK